MTVRRSPEWRKAISDGIRRSTKHNLGTGPGHRRWKGGQPIEDGYRLIWLSPDERNNHQCRLSRGSYIREHVQVVERVLGRCLRRGEVVHHLNGNKLDNRNKNLLVCTQSYHMLLHKRMGEAWMREHLSGV